METETNDLAERMARAAEAFTLVAIEKKSLRAAAEILGVSHVTVNRDVKAYTQHIADEHGKTTVAERRAAQLAELDATTAKALAVYEYCMSDIPKGGKKPLAAIGALNSIAALQAHRRAIQGVDSPKEIRQDVDQTVHIVWDEGDDEPTDRYQYRND